MKKAVLTFSALVLSAAGSHADGVRPHFPSTTSNSHAALFTGAWGDTNGIAGNSMPVAPRAEHTILDRLSGFESTGLRAEAIWTAAARQGVPTAALETTQAYPFTSLVTGGDPSLPLTIVNSYQTETVSKALYLHHKDVTEEACPANAPKSRKQARCFTWMAGSVAMHGELWARSGSYDTVMVSSSGHSVEVRYHSVETEPPQRRPLARYVSDALLLPDATEASPAVFYFRLFEVAPDGSDFFLYETPSRELAVYEHGKKSREAAERLTREVGGTISIALDPPLTDAPFEWGTPAWNGGDGTAERRYLEITELIARQAARYAEWLWKNEHPRLLIGYLPIPDEFEHAWKGLHDDPRYARFREWGYTIVNRFDESLAALRGPRDNIVLASDHGMAPVNREIRVNATLQQAGLQALDAQGRIDPSRTKAVHLTNCVLINTVDWKGGIVPLPEKAAVIAQAEKAIGSVRDPVTGANPVVKFYDTPEDQAKFGFGGPNGPDFCFDYLPGWTGYDGGKGDMVFTPVPSRGVHGFMPERADMKAIMVAAGPGVPRGQVWQGVRSIDLSPLVAHLLGIQPPKDSKGASPLH